MSDCGVVQLLAEAGVEAVGSTSDGPDVPLASGSRFNVASSRATKPCLGCDRVVTTHDSPFGGVELILGIG